MFIAGGWDALRRPESKVGPAETVVGPLPVDADTKELVRLNGAVQVIAGGLLAVGRMPRLSAAALAGSLVPTTLAGHRFWEEKDESARAGQRIHFLKNVAMLGGLVLELGESGGGWHRSTRRRRRSKATVTSRGGRR
jgi:uncharacterized membrane protein YphA (DoxX/SURF4 family)